MLRSQVQTDLDDQKTSADRNALGQFATPEALAMDLVISAREILGERPARFMDPAFGTGAFYSALLRAVPSDQITSARGYEVDPHYGRPASELWSAQGLALALQDFTTAAPPEEPAGLVDLLICNPPYVRHHHLDRSTKSRLGALVEGQLGLHVSGLAGLYVYFLLLCHRWLAPDALSVWLVPSEFMDVGYGAVLKRYLLHHVDLLRVHRFDPNEVQFGDALVSSAVIWFRNRPPSAGSRPEFTSGGTVPRPRLRRLVSREDLSTELKWTRFPVADRAFQGSHVRLDALFTIKRGLATGANKFFILEPRSAAELGIPSRFLRPILPSPRHVPDNIIRGGDLGYPQIDRVLCLVDCRLPMCELEEQAPAVAEYMRFGEAQGVSHRYLTSRRDPWYSQEEREPAPFLCTYMGRSGESDTPFRIMLNLSSAVATNVYLMMYPKGPLKRLLTREPDASHRAWEALQRTVAEHWSSSGRVYGGGLHKVEPSELGRLPATSILVAMPELRRTFGPQLSLL